MVLQRLNKYTRYDDIVLKIHYIKNMDESITLRYEVRPARTKMISYETSRPKLEMFTEKDDFEVS